MGPAPFRRKPMRTPTLVGLLCLAVAPLASLANPPFDLENVSGIATVLEAGVVEVGGLTLQLDGIRALSPGEMCAADHHWHCGDYARDVLAAFVEDQPIRCRLIERLDGSWRARCSMDRIDLQAFLVTRGLAIPDAQGGMYADLAKRSAQRNGPIHSLISTCKDCP